MHLWELVQQGLLGQHCLLVGQEGTPLNKAHPHLAAEGWGGGQPSRRQPLTSGHSSITSRYGVTSAHWARHWSRLLCCRALQEPTGLPDAQGRRGRHGACSSYRGHPSWRHPPPGLCPRGHPPVGLRLLQELHLLLHAGAGLQLLHHHLGAADSGVDLAQEHLPGTPVTLPSWSPALSPLPPPCPPFAPPLQSGLWNPVTGTF